ncbi:MAG: HU family DNA-binding protein [Dissulfurimicrobium sp.]|uniref:HU family DNA-binding protein n=1 Tax=Dissulfurimicrobium TaxID=1769732 RepID=UPI001EDBE0BC|nr:HU family DNA-binding protein [Dissulfurimicrobium hydrothermale]UKL14046.1 integration host factor subunit beta [Dissulfurimicrobium hydrothermale]
MASDKMQRVLFKGDLAARLKEAFPDILKRDLNEVVDTVFNSIAEALREGRRVELRGFGSLVVHRQKGRRFLNPKNNILTECPANRRIVFKPSKTISAVSKTFDG